MKKNYLLLNLCLAFLCWTGKVYAQLPLGMEDITAGFAATDATFALTTEDDRAGTFKSTIEVIGDQMFFTATNAANGDELYVTDGTAAGTHLLKDINPGAGNSSPRYLVVLGDKLYFQADDGSHGNELWESDGTEAGTKMVADINPAGSSSPDMLTSLGNKIIFRALTPASEAAGVKWLHVYDPATETVSLVAEIQARETGDAQIRRIQADTTHKVAYFIGQPANENEEMYITDGTSEGTRKLMDVSPTNITSSHIQWPVVFGDSILVWRQVTPRKYAGADSVNYTTHLHAQIWMYNYNQDTVKFLSHFNKTVASDGNGTDTEYAWPFTFNGKFYFRAHDGVHGVELCTTDWTPEGTRQVKDIYPGASNSYPEDWAVFKDQLIFRADGGPGNEGSELRYLDESTENVLLYAYSYPGDGNAAPKRTTTWQVDGQDSMLFFVATGPTTGGPELFVAKEVGEEAEFIGSVGASGSTPNNLTSWKNALFFTTSKVKRLFKYVYEPQPKIQATGDVIFTSSNLQDVSEITVNRVLPDKFTNKTVKIELRGKSTGFLFSLSESGPFGTEAIYTPNELESKFYLKPDYENRDPNELKSIALLELSSPGVNSLALECKTIIEPVFHHDMIYHVDFGNDSNYIENSMDVLGSYHSVFDQPFGEDAVTGKKWGYAQASWASRNNVNKWTSMREQNYGENPDGLLYKFEVEPGDYVIQYGWYEKYAARYIDIIVNGETIVDDLHSITLDYIVDEIEITQTNDTLTLNVISSDGGDNPYLSWIKIGKKCTDGCDTACFGEPICEYLVSQYNPTAISKVNIPELNITVFPNPANGTINVLFNEMVNDNTELNIFDMTGKLVYNQNILNQRTQVDISQLQKGFYLVKFGNQKGESVVKLLVD